METYAIQVIRLQQLNKELEVVEREIESLSVREKELKEGKRKGESLAASLLEYKVPLKKSGTNRSEERLKILALVRTFKSVEKSARYSDLERLCYIKQKVH